MAVRSASMSRPSAGLASGSRCSARSDSARRLDLAVGLFARVLFQAILDLAHADPEHFSRARGRAAQQLERAQDGLALDLGQGRAWNQPCRISLCWPRATQRGWKIVSSQLGTLAQDHSALDRVLQLADVARPVMREQGVQVAWSEPVDLLAVGPGILLDEVRGQRRDVAPAPAQRRERYRHDV